MECVQKTDKVLCQFDFTNVAQQDYYLMKRHTPLEGLYSHFLTVKQGDQVIQYQGYVAYRLPATKDNYVLIQAGSTIYSPMIELTRAYQLPRDGVYTVEYTGQLSVIPGDTMSLLQDTVLTWNHIMNKEGKVKASTHVSVADSHNLQILDVEEQSKINPLPFFDTKNSPQARISEACKAPVFRGEATNEHKQIVQVRHEQLCEYLPCVIAGLDQSTDLVKRWFGKSSSAHAAVKDVFQIIYDNLIKDEIIYSFGSEVCDEHPDWAAAAPVANPAGVREKATSICVPFFNEPDVCNGNAEVTKEMALLHEATHIYQGTLDDAYSVEDCLNLAKGGVALLNANNYGYYYCEAINHHIMDNPNTGKNDRCVILK